MADMRASLPMLEQRASLPSSGGDWFGSQGIPGYSNTGVGGPNAGLERGGMASGINPAGAAMDPFAYTNGSLLTPWTKKFEGPAGTPGGYTPPEIANFEFGQFNFTPGSVGRITPDQMTERPDFNFQFSQDDPSYQFRLKEGQRALENSAAARGTLLTGGTAKALQNYGQEAASQEYNNAFQRAMGTYQTNVNKEFGTFDRNWGAKFGAGQANQNAAIAEGNLGLQAATAGWDRNFQLARTQWQDAADAANRAASAAAGNSAADYNRALNEYMLEYDIFNRNQDTQFNRLMALGDLEYRNATLGMGMAGQHGANLGNIYAGAANAAAASHAARGSAWGNAAGNVANIGLDAYYANRYGLG